jgi:hypothetical protein
MHALAARSLLARNHGPGSSQVTKQARGRIFRGATRSEGELGLQARQLVGASSEIIAKGKASEPQFGKVVKLQRWRTRAPLAVRRNGL